MKEQGEASSHEDYSNRTFNSDDDVSLKNTNLSGADLSALKTLSIEQLSGANLLGCTLPPHINIYCQYDLLNAQIRNCSVQGLAVVTHIAILLSTAAGTSDLSWIQNQTRLAVPFLNSTVSPLNFFVLSPITLTLQILLLIYYTQQVVRKFHLFPKVLPDGSLAGDRISPWFWTDLLYTHLSNRGQVQTDIIFNVCSLAPMIINWVLKSLIKEFSNFNLLPHLTIREFLWCLSAITGFFVVMLTLSSLGIKSKLLKTLIVLCFGITACNSIIPFRNEKHSIINFSYDISRRPKPWKSADLANLDRIGGTELSVSDMKNGRLDSRIVDSIGKTIQDTKYQIEQTSAEVPALKLAPLPGISFKGMSARNSFLVNTILEISQLTKADFRGSILDGIRWEDATNLSTPKDKLIRGNPPISLDTVWFDNSSLKGSVFNECDIINTRFTGANLAVSQFANATLTKCWFETANLIGANLDHVRLDNCECTQTQFLITNLRGATFEGTNITSANFWLSNLIKANLKGAFFYTQEYADSIIKGKDGTPIPLAQSTSPIWPAFWRLDLQKSALFVEVPGNKPFKYPLKKVADRYVIGERQG